MFETELPFNIQHSAFSIRFENKNGRRSPPAACLTKGR
jgi:hypothetical protein